MELLLTGERIDADRAKEIGLAGWVVPHDELMDEARTLADRLVRAAPAGRPRDEGGRGALAAPPDRSTRSASARRCAGSRPPPKTQQEANETGSPSAWSPSDRSG